MTMTETNKEAIEKTSIENAMCLTKTAWVSTKSKLVLPCLRLRLLRSIALSRGRLDVESAVKQDVRQPLFRMEQS